MRRARGAHKRDSCARVGPSCRRSEVDHPLLVDRGAGAPEPLGSADPWARLSAWRDGDRLVAGRGVGAPTPRGRLTFGARLSAWRGGGSFLCLGSNPLPAPSGVS